MIELVRPSKGHITQPFGNIQPNGEPHTGDDFAYTNGAETFPDVYAAHDGVVECVGDSRALGWPNMYYLNPDFDRSDSWDSSAGNIVVILHEATGTKTTYSHLESWDVKPGQHVVAGQRIGTCGNTGNSYGKHLHFEVLETPYNFNTATYGRSKPEYVSISTKSSTITEAIAMGKIVYATDGQSPDVWRGDGNIRTKVGSMDVVKGAKYMAEIGALDIYHGEKQYKLEGKDGAGMIQQVWNLEIIGSVVK